MWKKLGLLGAAFGCFGLPGLVFTCLGAALVFLGCFGLPGVSLSCLSCLRGLGAALDCVAGKLGLLGLLGGAWSACLAGWACLGLGLPLGVSGCLGLSLPAWAVSAALVFQGCFGLPGVALSCLSCI